MYYASIFKIILRARAHKKYNITYSYHDICFAVNSYDIY